MLVSIGRRSQPERLVDMLSECHARIRHFLRLAIEIAERGDTSSVEVVESCEGVVRYFVDAFPLHIADEELSLLPRLVGQRPELDAALEAMRAQHVDHGDEVEALVEALRRVTLAPADAGLRLALGEVAQRVQRSLEQHLQLEERMLFPAVDALLVAAEQRRVVDELRDRRRP